MSEVRSRSSSLLSLEVPEKIESMPGEGNADIAHADSRRFYLCQFQAVDIEQARVSPKLPPNRS